MSFSHTKRIILAALSILLLSSALIATVRAASTIETVPVTVDSSNQAGWWIPLALQGDVSYLAYNAPGSTAGKHTVYVARRDTAGAYTTGCLRSASGGACWEHDDDIGHDQPSIAVDGSGYLHIFADLHGDDWRYFVSDAPGSVSNIYRRTGAMPGSGQFTYPSIATAPNGDLYLIIRNRSSAQRGAGELYHFANTTRVWTKVATFAYQSGDTVYPDDVQVDPNGDVHIIWEWRKGNPGPHRHLGSYLRYNPASGGFFDAAGASVSVPATTSTGGAIFYQPLEANEGFTEGGPGVQSAKLAIYGTVNRPTIAYRYRTSDTGAYHVRRARWNGSQWLRETLYNAGPTSAAIDITHDGNRARVYYALAEGTDRAFAVQNDGNGWSTPVSLAPGRPIQRLAAVMRPDGSDALYLTAPTSLSSSSGELFYAVLDAGTLVAPTQSTYVIDNTDAGFSIVGGNWLTGDGLSDKYGSNYRYIAGGAGATARVRWTPTLAEAGTYAVYVWYSAHPNRSTAAPYTVTHQSGSTGYTRNQQIDGGQWVLLGVHTFAAGSSGYVELSGAATDYVGADAVRFVRQ